MHSSTVKCITVISSNNEPFIFHRSLCPGIYGHEIVKAGLVSGLFGGSQDSKCTKVGRSLFYVVMCSSRFIYVK